MTRAWAGWCVVKLNWIDLQAARARASRDSFRFAESLGGARQSIAHRSDAGASRAAGVAPFARAQRAGSAFDVLRATKAVVVTLDTRNAPR